MILMALFLAATVSIFHLTGANNMIIWNVPITDGVFNIDPTTARLLSEYTLFGVIIAYNIFVIYLILNQKRKGVE